MLVTKDLCKNFDGFSLKNVSINLEPGYIYGFVGQNGAGKTTTIRLMLGLINPSYGQVEYFGGIDRREAKQRIGFVYDDCSYYEHITAMNMAKIIEKFYDSWEMDIFHQYANRFNLPLDKKIEDYSKGMKVKFSLACAMAHSPELLILDEPTSGLDPVFRNELLEIFQEYIEDGTKSIFFSTHITTDLEKVADYVYFIHDGLVKLESTSDALKEQFALVKGPRQVLEGFGDNLIGIEHMKYQSQCVVKNRRQLGDIDASDCVIEPASFEDILIHFTKGENQDERIAI